MENSVFVYDCINDNDLKILIEFFKIKIENDIKKENILKLLTFSNENFKSFSQIHLKFKDETPLTTIKISESENIQIIQDIILIIINQMKENSLFLLPSSGSLEIYISNEIRLKSKEFENEKLIIWKNFADCLEVIPRILIQNSNSKIDSIMKKLKEGNGKLGIDFNGKCVENNIFDFYNTKLSSLQYSFEIFQTLFEIDKLNKDKK